MNRATILSDIAFRLKGASEQDIYHALRAAYSRGRTDEAQVIKNWLHASLDFMNGESIVAQTLKALLRFIEDPSITPELPKDGE